jgi:hypothetical protein
MCGGTGAGFHISRQFSHPGTSARSRHRRGGADHDHAPQGAEDEGQSSPQRHAPTPLGPPVLSGAAPVSCQCRRQIARVHVRGWHGGGWSPDLRALPSRSGTDGPGRFSERPAALAEVKPMNRGRHNPGSLFLILRPPLRGEGGPQVRACSRPSLAGFTWGAPVLRRVMPSVARAPQVGGGHAWRETGARTRRR